MLKGKTAVVTGSTSGIGLGIARALAAQGADILLNGFGDAEPIEKLRASLGSEFGVRVAYSAADMSKPDDINRMVAEATRDFGKVDILVNNAGIQFTAPVHEFPPERWDAVIAINLLATFHAIRAVLPQMLGRNWGRIVNIASAHGLVASVHKVAYVAAKHGVLGITKVVALETAPTGVTCNAVCPGWVLTPLVQKQIDDIARDKSLPADTAKIKLLAGSLELSTPYEIRQALLWIALLAGRIDASLAATSGVSTADEVVKYLLAGADVVMTASSLLRHGPGHIAVLRQGLEQWMESRGFDDIGRWRGQLAAAHLRDREALVRAQYIHILTGYQGGG